MGIGFALGSSRQLLSISSPYTRSSAAPEGESLNYFMMTISSLVALFGFGVAWLMYIRQPDLPTNGAVQAQGLYQLSLNKFHIDELYDSLILKPLAGLTTFYASSIFMCSMV